MLVLTRKLQEKITIAGNITITVLRVKGQTVRIGIEAPREIRVVRGELPMEASPNRKRVGGSHPTSSSGLAAQRTSQGSKPHESPAATAPQRRKFDRYSPRR
jgi:carbon storage regulator CsrA